MPDLLRHGAWRACLAAAMYCSACGLAAAQSSSLYGEADDREPLMLSDSSWFYLETEPPRDIKVQDIVTVIVLYSAQVTSDGELDKRKRGNIDAILANWVRFDGLNLKPAPQVDGDPRIKASLTSQYRAQAGLDVRDGVKFRIACTVVDVRPNGNLILEAHRSYTLNEEIWEESLTGIIRREDVLPNNTVLSENVADLKVQRCTDGMVYDGYRRGWFLRIFDKFNPF